MDVATANAPEQAMTRLVLDLRGTRFTIEQDMLMNLPESVLLCLFPNGLVLSRQQQQAQQQQQQAVAGQGSSAAGTAGTEQGDAATGDGDDDEEEVYMVDFDPACLSYVLGFFRSAQEKFYGRPGKPSRRAVLAQQHASQQLYGDGNDFDGLGGMPGPTPLMTKQAVIVLREELEYFSIPSKTLQKRGIAEKERPASKVGNDSDDSVSASDVPANTVTTPALLTLKQKCGEALLERKQIFTALQRNVNKENNMAEQHLIDMLCMSGFDREDTWGFRAVEPNRCCITSIALVLLKTGITAKTGQADGSEEAVKPTEAAATSPLGGSMVDEFDVDQQQLSTAQKLLLFWRKPARKCWWDGVDVVLPLQEGESAADGVKADGNASAAAPGPDGAAADTSKTVDLEEVAANAAGGMTQAEIQLLKEGRGRKTRVWARRVWTLELSLI